MKDIKRRRNRIFGASILLLMVVLAVGTAALAASNGTWTSEGSYSLVIQKQFATDNIPADDLEKVLEQAKEQTYRFHIEGYRLDKDKNRVEIDDYVEISPNSTDWVTDDSEPGVLRWKLSDTLYSDGPIHVTVTEITNDVTLTVGDVDYNMGDSRTETTTLFTESPQVRELNSNGKITISRPKTKLVDNGNGSFEEVDVTTTSSFHIYNEWVGDEDQKPGNWQSVDQTVKLEPGADPITLTNLPAGRYTIEDLSVSGYQIQLGERSQEVASGETGTFYINSKPGRLEITAGGTEGDGGIHYYVIKRVSAPEGAEPFTDRTTEGIASKKTYILENLPRGEYEVTEYTFSAPTKFKVDVAETVTVPKETALYSSQFGKGTASYIKFTAGGDYITDLKFGPLRNSSDKVISSTYSYDFGIRYRKTADQEGYTTTTWNTPRLANTRYSFTSPIYPRTDNSLAFSVWNVTAKTGDHVDLSWNECTRKEVPYEPKEANRNYTYIVDERGWMKITAPAASGDLGAGEVSYTYTLRKDADGPAVKTLELEPGQSGTIEGLEAGSYLLMETVTQAKPVGFTMKISGDPFGSTEAGSSFDLEVMGSRQLTITKLGNTQDGGRSYTFAVNKLLDNGYDIDPSYTTEIVKLMAGENNGAKSDENPKGTGQIITLEAGRYRVTPTDDMTEIFELTCSDSSQVHAEVPAGSAATVTFTNVFTPGTLGYRYVHEYYLLKDGRYIYEGNSPITSVGGRSDSNETYTAIDIAKETDYTFVGSNGRETHTYAYMPKKNAYGLVIPDAEGSDTADSEGLRLRNRGTEKRSSEEDPKTIYYKVDEALTSQKYINVDQDKSQIIVLRYFRVLPEDQQGSYKYVHIYYRREADGDKWEGTSEITTVPGQLGLPYSASSVALVPDYRPADSDETYHYVHNGRPSYGTLTNDHTAPHIELVPIVDDPNDTNHHHYNPNSNATHVTATKDGQEIIILRYYRDPSIGSYKVVHEYYLREELEDQDPGDVSEETEGESGVDGQSESGIALQAEDGTSPEAEGDSEAEDPSTGTGSSGSSGTLSSDGRYAYTFEGAREIQTISAPLGSTHKEDEVDQLRTWKPDGTQYTYTYNDAVYGNTSGSGRYSYVPNMEWAASTEEGDQIIILRYYRETEPDEPGPEVPEPEGPGGGGGSSSPDGSYRVVHEYYLQDSTGKKVLEGTSDISERSGRLNGRYDKSDVREVPEFNGQKYTYTDCGYGTSQSKDSYTAQDNKTYVVATERGDQIIILRYVRTVEDLPEGAYKVVHEYYFRTEEGDVLEGVTEIDTVDGLPLDETQYTADGVARRYTFGGREYVYDQAAYGKTGDGNYQADPEMVYVVATEDGQEIIILRYIREEEPEKPELPEKPEEPEEPQLPDPNDPDSPETVTVEEDGVPKTYVKVWDPEEEEWVYIPEDEVPLGDQSPKTGDSSRTALWAALAAGSLCGLCMLAPAPHKRKNR